MDHSGHLHLLGTETGTQLVSRLVNTSCVPGFVPPAVIVLSLWVPLLDRRTAVIQFGRSRRRAILGIGADQATPRALWRITLEFEVIEEVVLQISMRIEHPHPPLDGFVPENLG